MKANNLINKEEPKFQNRYNWTEEEKNKFIKDYYLKVSKESNLMPGFKAVYDLLRKQKYELIVITARGISVKEMKDDAIRVLNENNIVFDKYYWNIENKLEICKKENIDFMIDDDWHIIEELAKNKIKTFYFRDTNLKRLKEDNYITEVNNWGEIYRELTKEHIQNII